MSRVGSNILDTGMPFPQLSLQIAGGAKLQLPDGLTQPWNVVLFYRGSWCPFCQAQLKSFQSGLDKLSGEGIGVLAASVDPLDKTQATQQATGATFPLAYGLSVRETAEAIGAFYDAAPAHTAPYLHSTGFLLGPDRKVVVAVYSSSAIGRLQWQDVLGMVQYLKSTAK